MAFLSCNQPSLAEINRVKERLTWGLDNCFDINFYHSNSIACWPCLHYVFKLADISTQQSWRCTEAWRLLISNEEYMSRPVTYRRTCCATVVTYCSITSAAVTTTVLLHCCCYRKEYCCNGVSFFFKKWQMLFVLLLCKNGSISASKSLGQISISEMSLILSKKR